MRVQLFGTLCVDGVPLEVGRRERQVLALLALAGGTPVSVGRLVDALWGDAPPANPANALQATVSRLRRALDGLAIVFDSGAYRLDVLPGDVDVLAFEAAAARPGADARTRADRLDRAIEQWSGRPAFADDPVFEDRLRLLDAMLVDAREQRAAAHIELGDARAVIGDLEAMVGEHPLRERSWELLMRALYATGRPADALAAFRRVSTLLGEELGVEPGPALVALEERILMHDPRLDRERPRTIGALPASRGALVGRRRDLERLVELLSGARLATIVGPGGAGKTSLAIETGRIMAEDLPVWFVDLTSARNLDEVVGSMVERLSLETVGRVAERPLDRVAGYLAANPGVVVLDNCEHVIDDAAHLAGTLLDGAPGLRIVATSREPLALAGEHVHRLDPLHVPAAGADRAEILGSPAVQLFAARARQAGAAIEGDLPSIAQIVRLLDGLPLALELVAAMAASMPADEILRRLSTRSPLPASTRRDLPDRHRSLEAAIDWSLGLADEVELALMERIAVFRSAVDLDVVDGVCSGAPVEVDGLHEVLRRLVDKSLVVFEGGRYRVLEVIRHHVLDRMDAAELDAIRSRHAAHMVGMARAERSSIEAGPDQVRALRHLDRHAVELREAMQWSLANDPATAIGIAATLVWAASLRRRSSGVEELVTEAVNLGSAPRDAELVYAKIGLALVGAVGAYPTGVPDLSDTIALADELNLPRESVLARAVAALWQRTDLETGVRLMAEADRRAELLDDEWISGVVDIIGANVELYARNLETALRRAERAVERLRRTRDSWREATALTVLGSLQRMRGDYPAAEASYREAESLTEELDLRYDGVAAITDRANVATLDGRLEDAGRLLDRAVTLTDRLGLGTARAFTLNTMGRFERAHGRLDSAEAAHRHALAIYRESDAPSGLAHTLDTLGRILSLRGDAEGAVAMHRESLDIHDRWPGDHFGRAFALEGMALARATEGRGEDAARLLAEAHALRSSYGAPLPEAERRDVERAERLARESMGDDVFDQAWAGVDR